MLSVDSQLGSWDPSPFQAAQEPGLCPHPWTALTRGVDPLACWSWSVATIAVLIQQMDDRGIIMVEEDF